jgi:hypothetical protein
VRLALVLALLAACKGKHEDKPQPWTVDARCEAAARQAALGETPLEKRAALLLDACHVCTPDWTPILRWNTPPEEGGPPRIAIEKAMLDCHAYCDPNAKQRFLGALDAARGTALRTPWRELAQICKGDVSAGGDARFIGGGYFALDRIARAIAWRGVHVDRPIELPLPLVAANGVSPALPEVAAAQAVPSGRTITVLGDSIYVGHVPTATLTAHGLELDLGTAGYPGIETPLETLVETRPDAADRWNLLVAPREMPAGRLLPVVGALAGLEVYLAAAPPAAPDGWTFAARIPVALASDGEPITVTPEMTVQQLAAAIAQHKGSRVMLRSP